MFSLFYTHYPSFRAIVSKIDIWGIDMLFVVGGNGGNAGANAIQEKLQENNIACAVVGIPKSIDNDILLVSELCLFLFKFQKSSIKKHTVGEWAVLLDFIKIFNDRLVKALNKFANGVRGAEVVGMPKSVGNYILLVC